MKQVGIFAKTFSRPGWRGMLEAAAESGFNAVQFNFSCAGLPTLPDCIDESLTASIRGHCERLNLPVVGVSATFNMIDPDMERRHHAMAQLPVVMKGARELGCGLISLCTGTRDPGDIWRAHPDNETDAAWGDLLASMEGAVMAAEAHNVVLGVEPETGNVVSSAAKARKLLDEMQSSRLKIVIDAANLFHHGRVHSMQETIKEAIDVLGPEIVMAHAKEIDADGVPGSLPPGEGILDWECYASALRRAGFAGPVVTHGLVERDAARAATFLRKAF